MATNDYRSTEVREEIVRDNRANFDGELGMPIDRRERVEVTRDAEGEYREHVVEDVGNERRLILAKVSQFVYLLTGLLELGLGLRVLLKLIAANPASPFARLVYGATELFVWPFQGLTVTPAASNGMTLEISTFFAMVVYAVAAWGLVQILYLLFSPSSSRSVSVYHHDRR
ncbi:MAG: YggT family protein [Chloroflexi bacterium]|nr:YggT family protein [Chloroflexota bacterium]